jgi:hypothetical protein
MKASSSILTPRTKLQNVEWHHAASLKEKKARTILSAGKIMGILFWNVKGCTLLDSPYRKETVAAVCYVQMLQKLWCALRDKHPVKRRVILQYNTHPYTVRLTPGKIEKFGWKVIPHFLYNLDLTPLGYQLFRCIKDHMTGQKYKNKAIQ